MITHAHVTYPDGYTGPVYLYGLPVRSGSLDSVIDALDPFATEYVIGMRSSQMPLALVSDALGPKRYEDL